MNLDIVSYYNDRAKEYEKVYLNPDEQGDLREAARIFEKVFSGKEVLEVACGTGYWTELIAKTAASIYAVDINESMIEIARSKRPGRNVAFAVADMYRLKPGKKFDAAFGGFIWSHIPIQELQGFLKGINELLKPGADLVFIDGNPLRGSSHDTRNITKTDAFGNTYQTRKLENGTLHLVLKNFPTKELLFQKLSPIATDLELTMLEYYWIASCKID